MVRPAPILTMKRLLQLAPVERLRQLKELLNRGAAVEAEAVRAWQQRLGGAG
jgi:hypothetical protein